MESMEYPMQIQGNMVLIKMTISSAMELSDISFSGTRVPGNSREYSMELSYISFCGSKVPLNFKEYSMEFHGTLVSFEIAPS